LKKKKSIHVKKRVGKFMEKYYADNFKCIRCGSNNLHVKNDRSPSLDITCPTCPNKLEIKSKCLSVHNLPKDINLPHGSFQHYINRQAEGLDIAIIIYKANRKTKEITIREIMYFKNNDINTNIINIIPQKKSRLSKIIINNREDPRILKVRLPDRTIINFKSQIENIVV
tara:strand:- start:3128 stop:3637 length:510 start_codon:yes stop_codon:yes gene_type:complete